MNVLGLIPARGGSKGIPRKNIRVLGGKPVINWTIEAAKASLFLSRVVVSTDDLEIANCARLAGAEIPFMRPPELADDQVPTLPVLRHALSELARTGWFCEAVCLLQPTTPFREPGEIDRCLRMFQENEADSVITMAPIPTEHHPEWALVRNQDATLKLFSGSSEPPPSRQVLQPAYYRDGSVYVTRTDVIESQGSLYGDRLLGLTIERERFVNLDVEDDWERAVQLVMKVI